MSAVDTHEQELLNICQDVLNVFGQRNIRYYIAGQDFDIDRVHEYIRENHPDFYADGYSRFDLIDDLDRKFRELLGLPVFEITIHHL